MSSILFRDIENWMDAQVHGWASKEKAGTMVGAVLSLRPRIVVEIGVWSGKSLIPMALALRHLNNDAKIIAIDPWQKEASIEGQKDADLDYWSRVDHENVYEIFCRALRDTGTAPWVKVYRCRSEEFDAPKDWVIDILHIDGNHGETASIYDVQNFASLVRVGGMLFMDDVGWAKKATEMIPKLGFRELYPLDTGIMYQRFFDVGNITNESR